jgi:hypothetical protein
MAGRVVEPTEIKLARIEENLKNLTDLMKDGFESIDRRLREDFVKKEDFEKIKSQVQNNTKLRNGLIAFVLTGVLASLLALVLQK